MRKRLSLLIPLILALFSIANSALIYFQEDRLEREAIEAQAIRETGLQMAQLQSILYNRLTKGDEQEALLSLSLAAMRPGTVTLLLADSANRVVMANHYLAKGEEAAGVSGFSEVEARLAIQSGVSHLEFGGRDEELLHGYFPLVVQYQQGGLEKETGVLYVEQDFSRPIAEAHRQAIDRALTFGIISMAIALLVAFILHRLVSRRVNVLVDASARFAGGDYSVRTGLQGGDELAELGQTFDAMALRVGETSRAREQSLLDQRRVLQTAVDGYWQVDGQGRLIDVNEAYCQMSGYSREELLQMRIPDLEAKETSPEQVRAHMEYIFEKGYDRFETLHRRKDGVIIDVEIVTTYWKDKNEFFVFIRDISERKRYENELKRARDQYDRLAKNIPIGVYLVHSTPDGVFAFKYVSPRFCQMLGLSADAVYADSSLPFRVIHPDEQKAFMALNLKAVRDRKLFQWEGRSLIGGEERWLRIQSQPEPQEGGGECIWDGVVMDITERKLAQIESQHSQELLNEAQRLGHLGSWELDLVKNELRWSEEIYRIFELDPAKFRPSYEAFLSVIHPDDRDRVNRAYTRSLEDRQEYDIEHRLLMPGGRIKWVREHCFSEFDDSGRPLRSVGAVQDITQHKLTEESLRVAAVAFETHEAIMITDTVPRIMRVNKAFEDITGYSEAEVLGKNPHMLSSGRQDREFYEDMWQQLLSNGTWSGEIWDRRKDGRIYPKWLTISAVSAESGETTGYVGIFNDITARKQAEEEIRNLAFYDPLTRLPNRRLLLDRLRLALSASARSHQYGAILFLDLDRFKVINDTLGHDYGDEMLVEVGERLSACVREADTVSRLGGDEFVILIEHFSNEVRDASHKVALIAEKIRAALAVPYHIRGKEFHSSPSIGVCLYRGNEESVETLLKHADMAMYQAKESGRNAVHFFDPMMQEAVEERARLEVDLRHAIQERQLRLYYQVQVDNNSRPLGVEALVRWDHPQRGIVPPGQFIQVAEESTLILGVGQWVLEEACRQLEAWGKSEATRNLSLAVNVSGQQFRQPDFVERVLSAIQMANADPSRLKLELTESVVLNDVADVVKKMYALKAIGVALSLDDFGTGYSSLSYLKKLPLDQIKIDQSFVRDITTDPNDAVMVQTIIDLAKNFRLNVIAEGVETLEQHAFLKENGCMAYQGYLFGRPVPIGEFEKLLDRKK